MKKQKVNERSTKRKKPTYKQKPDERPEANVGEERVEEVGESGGRSLNKGERRSVLVFMGGIGLGQIIPIFRDRKSPLHVNYEQLQVRGEQLTMTSPLAGKRTLLIELKRRRKFRKSKLPPLDSENRKFEIASG